MSTKTSPVAASSSARQVRTKDKLKHSRNETRRRARIREQFEGLKTAVSCDKKDRYNILQAATEAVHRYQLRITQLENLVSKYESATKTRFQPDPVAQLPKFQPPPATPHSSKRAPSKRRSARTTEEDEEEEEEEEAEERRAAARSEEEEEQSDMSDDEPELHRGLAPVNTATASSKMSTGASRSIGIQLSGSHASSAHTTAVTTGTAVNVLAALATTAAASSSAESSTPVGVRSSEKNSPHLRAQSHPDSAPGTGSSGSKKRKLTDPSDSMPLRVDSPLVVATPVAYLPPQPQPQQAMQQTYNGVPLNFPAAMMMPTHYGAQMQAMHMQNMHVQQRIMMQQQQQQQQQFLQPNGYYMNAAPMAMDYQQMPPLQPQHQQLQQHQLQQLQQQQLQQQQLQQQQQMHTQQLPASHQLPLHPTSPLPPAIQSAAPPLASQQAWMTPAYSQAPAISAV